MSSNNNNNNKRKGKGKGKKQFSVESLVEKAEKCILDYELELAEKFYLRGLEIEPENTLVLDGLSQLLLDCDRVEDALEYLLKSIDLKPDEGFDKYMNIGQLYVGRESLACFNKAFDNCLATFKEEDKKQDKNEELIAILKVKLGAICCSCVELFLTDLCFEKEAESECERLIEESLKWNPKNVDAYVLRTQVLCSQSKFDEASTPLLTSLLLWEKLDEKDWPSYTTRYSTAKLLIELENFEKAAKILEKLVNEDDENAECIYLLCFCYDKLDSGLELEMVELLNLSLTLLTKNIPDDQLNHMAIEQVQQLLEITEQKLEQNNEDDDDGDDILIDDDNNTDDMNTD
eukprot:TRINITY_DN7920_c0_g1_i1.p1 TRINITY_DN7920_c0_g1~~TRINITY_DN7920_c0_g1_i1.p1  ORF type:complete len:346 (+),score=125.03 TRINITY_DN7920_c0_g1_i1:185-1222(+)